MRVTHVRSTVQGGSLWIKINQERAYHSQKTTSHKTTKKGNESSKQVAKCQKIAYKDNWPFPEASETSNSRQTQTRISFRRWSAASQKSGLLTVLASSLSSSRVMASGMTSKKGVIKKLPWTSSKNVLVVTGPTASTPQRRKKIRDGVEWFNEGCCNPFAPGAQPGEQIGYDNVSTCLVEFKW